MGPQQFGVDPKATHSIATQVCDLKDHGVQVGLVIGGGNIFRGVKGVKEGMERTTSDHIGMLATIINGLSLQQAFLKLSCDCRVMSAVPCGSMTEPYCWKEALAYLERGTIVIFVGGTGNPYFTTDSAAALRALEIKAEVLMKATKVDGIYNKDPVQYADAVKFDRISYSEVLSKQLGVMDAAAIALCRENRLPIRVINLFEDGMLKKAVYNEPVGTIVEEEHS